LKREISFGNPLKDTYFSLLAKAEMENKFISFDPNFRQDLWKNNVEAFVQLSRKAAAYADFVKVSHEELELMTGEKDIPQAITQLHDLGPAMIAVTMGKDGSIISNQENEALVPSKPVTSIDATGAGDAFIGAMLFQIAGTLQDENKSSVHDFSYLQEAVRFANCVGGAVCTKVGSLSALPTMEEVDFD
jgi:fructokinase